MTSGTINDSTKTYKWTVNFFYVIVPLTIACGIWTLDTLSHILHVGSFLLTLTFSIIPIARLLTFEWKCTYTLRETLYSFAQGIIWACAMIFAWPDSWVGFIYLFMVMLNIGLHLHQNKS